MDKIRFELFNEMKWKFFLNNDQLSDKTSELERFISKFDCLDSLDFAKSVMFSHELKANNEIEGYFDDVLKIESIIKTFNYSDSKDKRVIWNLYRGYKYILGNDTIDKLSLRNLYAVLSDNLLSKDDINNMDDYYRKNAVYIFHSNNINSEPNTCMAGKYVDEYMNYYFEFLNNGLFNETSTDVFIKSQILHFYLVFIHPYYDINGRTSRTTAMWHLLNNEAYPYIIFNRGISLKKNEYYKVIQDTIKYMNLTYFINYMLGTVHTELEKEVLAQRINELTNSKFNDFEYQTLLYFFSMKGIKTVMDFATLYNRYNDKKSVKEVYDSMIVPLLDSGILDIERYTSAKFGDTQNQVLKLGKQNILDLGDFNHLNI